MDEFKINYIGYVNHGNIGDEALLYKIKSMFPNYRFIPNYENISSKITFFGGGTLLPLWHAIPNKYNYVFGTAVRDPLFEGKTEFNPVMIRRLKSFNFRLVGVRDYFSKLSLEKHGIASEVIGDPCLSLGAVNPCTVRDSEKIAVCIGFVEKLWGHSENKVFQEVAKLCQILKKQGFDIYLIPFNEHDITLIKDFAEKNDLKIFEEWRSIEATLNFIASCKLLIGEKLHSMVFSAAVFTPFLPIEYRPKCLHFAESIGFEKYCHITSKLDAEEMFFTFKEIIGDWQHLHNTLKDKVTSFRNKQKEFINLVAEDIKSLPNDKWSEASFTNRAGNRLVLYADDSTYSVSIRAWCLWNKFVLLPAINHF